MNTNDCLAATGAGDVLPYLIVAAVLLVAGVVAVFGAKKRSRWAAFALLPLLLGAGLLGVGAPSAQAAQSVDCESPATEAPVATETPIPTPTATCTPTAAAEDIVISGEPWELRFDELLGYSKSFTDGDSTRVADLLALSTADRLVATITESGVSFINAEEPPTDVTFETEVYSDASQGRDYVILSTEQSFLYVPDGLLAEAIDAQLPNIHFVGDTLTVVIDVPQSDGCGGTVNSTITIDGELPLGP